MSVRSPPGPRSVCGSGSRPRPVSPGPSLAMSGATPSSPRALTLVSGATGAAGLSGFSVFLALSFLRLLCSAFGFACSSHLLVVIVFKAPPAQCWWGCPFGADRIGGRLKWGIHASGCHPWVSRKSVHLLRRLIRGEAWPIQGKPRLSLDCGDDSGRISSGEPVGSRSGNRTVQAGMCGSNAHRFCRTSCDYFLSWVRG